MEILEASRPNLSSCLSKVVAVLAVVATSSSTGGSAPQVTAESGVQASYAARVSDPQTAPESAAEATSSEGSPQRGDASTIITLIRHGESEVTVDRIIGGFRTCRGLSPLGRQQAEALRTRLVTHDELHADMLISSEFPRAIETAEIIRPGFGERIGSGAIEQWPDFGEHDPGPRIDGMSFEAYVEEFGTPEWSGDPDVEIFPGGETTRRFHERVRRGVVELEQRFAGRHVVVACHGGVVDAVFRSLLGLPMTGGFDLHTLNTAITTFERPEKSSERWRLSRYNDTAHLAGLLAATERRTVKTAAS